MRTTFSFFFLALILCFGFISCQKENEAHSFQVMLTDAPYDAQEVNVEIKEVQVKYSNENEAWSTLNTNASIYNLLALQNNVQAALANGNSPEGTIKELRLILGSANSIKIADQTFPLTIPSGAESGLKIKVDKKLAASLNKLVVDFDAGLSVVKTESGEYQLKPVLKIK